MGPSICVAILRAAREYDLDFAVVLQVVQRDDDVPAIHLSLIERLRAVIQAAGIAQPYGVRRRKQSERGMKIAILQCGWGAPVVHHLRPLIT